MLCLQSRHAEFDLFLSQSIPVVPKQPAHPPPPPNKPVYAIQCEDYKIPHAHRYRQRQI